MFLTLFIGGANASIYQNNTSKNTFVLKPRMISYQYGFDMAGGVGGSNFVVENGVIIPAHSIFEGEEGYFVNSQDVETKDKISYYIVQAGDNVEKIAKKFGVSKDTIIWENNLSSKGFLKLKQKLTILPVTGVKHTVKKGETLDKIAKKYSVKDSDTIRAFNDLKDDFIKVGADIIVPDGKIKIVKAYVAKKTSRNSAVGSKTSSVSSSHSLAKYFIRPTGGRATSLYGKRWNSFHRGIDYSGGRGASIMAAADGEVVKVYSGCKVGSSTCGGGYGNWVEIKHSNGLKTRYAHLISIKVRKGQKVVQGQVVGGMGNTGHVFPKATTSSSTAGTHLHFEIVKGSQRINPNFLK